VVEDRRLLAGFSIESPHRCCSAATAVMYRVAQKSKLLILAVNEINNSQTGVIFAKFIPTLVEKMFELQLEVAFAIRLYSC